MFTEADDAIEFNFYVKRLDRKRPLSQAACRRRSNASLAYFGVART
jgi:hypothetical protein